VPRGSLSLPFNAVGDGGLGAGDLIDAAVTVTDVRVETP
jgi:hypothetical protein